MKRLTHLAFAALMALVASAGLTATAGTITEGFTFSVASNGSNQSVGNHFHSSTGGDFGNPVGKAEVGEFDSEEVRGLSEYDLTGLSNSPMAFVTFDVFSLGGLFAGTNDFPFIGDIDVIGYTANNTEDISDYQAPAEVSIGTFSTAGLQVGDLLSFDVTTVYNSLIDFGVTSGGVRLQIAAGTDPAGGAIIFDNFRLTTDDQTTTAAVPEPSTFALLGIGGLALVGYGVRRRRQQAA